MNPVTLQDLADRWRPLSNAEGITAAAVLEDAWAIVTTLEPTVEDRLTAGSLDPNTVRGVVVAMVLRFLKNPDGKFQESLDDYSYTRDKAVSAGLLYLGDDERLRLRVRRGSAFTITPSC